MTVDRVHVLATPGLDRHAAYVALSRHRDAVQLHYGRDDFADRDRLAGTLGRDRVKDMAGDYGREFADRRSLTGDIRNRIEDGWRRLKDAVVGHACAVSAIFRDQEHDRATPPEWRRELGETRRALDAIDPHHSRDAERAYKADPELAREAAGGRTARAIRAMQLEAKLRTDPVRRADRFVERWRTLDAAQTRAYRQGDYDGMKRIKNDMGAMAKGLERDAQVESILAGRKQQLGIQHLPSENIGRSLAMSIGLDIGRGRGLGI